MFRLNCSTMYLHLGNHEAIDFGPVSPVIPFRKICDGSKVRLMMYLRRIISMEVGN